MKNQDVLMSSGDDDGSTNWETPRDFFQMIDRIYGPYELDACATAKNTKCPVYFSSRDNALEQPWRGRVFCNPPYGRGVTGKWIAKAEYEARVNDAAVTMLVPARTDTKWWHEIVLRRAAQVIFVKGRIKFHLPGQEDRNSATFPSALIMFTRHGVGTGTRFGGIEVPKKRRGVAGGEGIGS